MRDRAGTRPFAALFLLSLVLLQLAPLHAGGSHAAVALAAAATTAAASALVVCALLLSRCAPAVPPTRVRTAIRDRDRRTAFLPQRDPDAAGRRRPRAPGRALTTTVVA
ncbi:hypothetical protein HUT11_17550 [Streptomyces seoulensis]|nr:hypothetical protein HUT11_17550 [Streptomyces seoulensis]